VNNDCSRLDSLKVVEFLTCSIALPCQKAAPWRYGWLCNDTGTVPAIHFLLVQAALQVRGVLLLAAVLASTHGAAAAAVFPDEKAGPWCKGREATGEVACPSCNLCYASQAAALTLRLDRNAYDKARNVTTIAIVVRAIKLTCVF
jgi:hypothetical protein